MTRTIDLLFGAALTVAAIGCEGTSLFDAGARPDARAEDGGIRLDAGADPDATPAPDAAPADGGMADSGTPAPDAAAPPDSGEPPCDLSLPADDDRDRVLLVGHPFGAVAGTHGTEILGFSIPAPGGAAQPGTPIADGMRLDVSTRPARISFVPAGSIALVLGEDGTLVSVSVGGASALAVIDMVMLPPALYGGLTVTRDGRTVYVTGSNVDETSGVSTVRIACDGRLEVVTTAFLNVRLAEGLVLSPDERRAILLGGQTVFEPIDDDDVRLYSVAPGGFTPIDSYDVFQDFIDAGNIAISPDGSTVILPNGSPFSTEGAQAAIVRVAGDTLIPGERVLDLGDARDALFSPDGSTALVSQLEPGRVAVLRDMGAGYVIVDRITGIGLAEQMAPIERGALSGRVYVSSVDPQVALGPNIAMLRFDGPGMVSDLGQLALGNGNINIPGPIAVTP